MWVATIYTIGHSTRTLDELVAALKAHGISTLVDIRLLEEARSCAGFPWLGPMRVALLLGRVQLK